MNLKGALRFTFGLALVLIAASVSAHAVGGYVGAVSAPEMGLSEIGSAVTLLSGGYLVLSSRFRGKK